MTTSETYDYLIIGAGLAGVCFAEIALNHQKSIYVFNSGDSSSEVAPGVFNAVILKRFTLSLSAQKQIDLVSEFYPKIEKRIGKNILHHLPTYRRLGSIEEQNNFIVSSDKPLFSKFLDSEIIFKDYNHIKAPFGYGLMKQTGYVNTRELLSGYKSFLKDLGLLSETQFDFASLDLTDKNLSYKGIKAKHIIFSEGFSMLQNPYFSDLPLDGAKGEVLVIKADTLDLDVMLKSDVFLLPLGNGFYKVGSTYSWNDKTPYPTENGKNELLEGLKNVIDCPFEVVAHWAGIRPTVRDRRPLVGQHHQHKDLFVLNGLGTRGIMGAPYIAQNLFEFIEYQKPLDKDIDIERFYQKKKKNS